MWYLEPKWLRWSWHPFSKVNGFWFTELTQKILSRKSCKHLMTRWPDEWSRFDTGRSLAHGGHPTTSKNPMSNFLTVGRKLGKLSYRWCLGLKKHLKPLTACRNAWPSSDTLQLAVHKFSNREEQIIGTQEKPQRIVVQRPLSRLQYLDSTKSSAKDLPLTHFNLWLVGSNLWWLETNRWNQTKSISFQVRAQAMRNVA